MLALLRVFENSNTPFSVVVKLSPPLFCRVSEPDKPSMLPPMRNEPSPPPPQALNIDAVHRVKADMGKKKWFGTILIYSF